MQDKISEPKATENLCVWNDNKLYYFIAFDLENRLVLFISLHDLYTEIIV